MICSVSAALLASGCATSQFHASSWEYKAIEVEDYKNNLETRLNNFANQGWMVVSVSTFVVEQKRQDLPSIQTKMDSIVLKRKKQ